MVAFLIFRKICQKCMSLADIFHLHKYQVLAFIIVLSALKKQQGSGKFKVWKVLIVKW